MWNLINDSEVPTASLVVDGAPALNKVRWSPSGHSLVVGDDQGKISLYEVNEAYANARPDDWTRFVRVLQDLKQSSNDMDEPVNNPSAVSTTATTTPAVLSSASQAQLTPVVSGGLTSVKSEPNFDYRTPTINNSSNYTSPSVTQAFMSQLKSSPVTPK